MIDIPSNLTDGDSVYLGDKRFVYNGGKLVPYVVTNVGTELTSPKLNVETLTEFRHSISGKPLYKKTINFGILPNATNKFMAHGIVGAEDIRVNVDDSYAYYLQEQYPIVWTDTIATAQWRAWTDRTNVGMKTGFNATSIAAYITLLYTKIADTSSSPVKSLYTGSLNELNLNQETHAGYKRNGKDVYQIEVDCGVLPNVTTKTIVIPGYNASYKYWLYSADSYAFDSAANIRLPLPYLGINNYNVIMYTIGDSIKINTYNNLSTYDITKVVLHYTK